MENVKKEMVSFEMVFAFWLQNLNAKHRSFNTQFDATAGIDYVGYFHSQFSLDEARCIKHYYEDEFEDESYTGEKHLMGEYKLDDIFRIKVQAIWGYKVEIFYGNCYVFEFHIDEDGQICNPSIKSKKVLGTFQKWIDEGGIGEKFMNMVLSSSIINEDEYARLCRNSFNHPDKQLAANHDEIELKDGRIVELFEDEVKGMVGEWMTILRFMDKDCNNVEGVWDLLYDTDKKMILELQERLNKDNEANAISMVI